MPWRIYVSPTTDMKEKVLHSSEGGEHIRHGRYSRVYFGENDGYSYSSPIVTALINDQNIKFICYSWRSNEWRLYECAKDDAVGNWKEQLKTLFKNPETTRWISASHPAWKRFEEMMTDSGYQVSF